MVWATRFLPAEATDAHNAARSLQVTPQTIRRWCRDHGIGRKVGGRYYVSRPALAMFLDGAGDALARYAAGDRDSAEIRAYIDEMAVIVQPQNVSE